MDDHHLLKQRQRQDTVPPSVAEAGGPAAAPVQAGPVLVDQIFGVPISLLGGSDASRVLGAREETRPFAYVVTPNAQHMVRLNSGDADFISGYQAAWLWLVDSQILRLLSRLLFSRDLPLASGSDLTVRLFRDVIRPDDAITVIGGGEEVARRLQEQFSLTRLALHNPPMGFINNPAEVDRCIQFVESNPARFVFLVVGAPKSEKLARLIHDRGQATGIGLCVGSSLLFVTGMVQRAPRWVSRFALEWAFRLVLNPRSHFRRVFVESLPLLGIALRARLRGDSRGTALFTPTANRAQDSAHPVEGKE